MPNSLNYPHPNPKLTYRYPFEQGNARQHRKEMLEDWQEAASIHVTVGGSKLWRGSSLMYGAFGIFEVGFALNTQPAQ